MTQDRFYMVCTRCDKEPCPMRVVFKTDEGWKVQWFCSSHCGWKWMKAADDLNVRLGVTQS